MPPSSRRQLTADELTAARLAYETGASYRDLAARFGVDRTTLRKLLVAVGVTSRPVGWPQREPVTSSPAPRPAVDLAPGAGGKLRIPMRTREERRVDLWTAAEQRAIALEVAAGRVQRIRRGRSAYSEGRKIFAIGASYEFGQALKRLRAA